MKLMPLANSADSLASQKIAIVDADGEWSYGFISSDPYGLRAIVQVNGRIALRTNSPRVVASAIFALEGYASEVHLIPGDASPLLDKGIVFKSEFPNSPSRINLPRNLVNTQWVLYTSGTTGEPKPISHSLENLARTVSSRIAKFNFLWGLLYDPNRMAGIQVILQAMNNQSTLVVPNSSLKLSEKIAFLIDHNVTALSATPTLWRQILQILADREWNLRQITLGGEIADQRVLTALKNKFPIARIIHIFASTETGVAFAVSDGQAGFPHEFLTNPPNGVGLQIVDGILHVEVLKAGKLELISTNDAVEISEERVHFLGRSTGQVNIGGSKVWPEQIEIILRSHPNVLDASVTVKSNPFSGSILTAQVVAVSGENAEFGIELRKWMKESWPKYFVPASISVVDKLSLNVAGKAVRS